MPDEFATIALVADDRIFATEHVATLEVRAFKQPVFGPMHGVFGGVVHVLPVALAVAAIQEADARQLVFRPTDEVVAPDRTEQFPVARFVEWVVAEVLLPTRECAAVVFCANLPATGVAAKERNVPTVADKALEVAPRRRPGWPPSRHAGWQNRRFA